MQPEEAAQQTCEQREDQQSSQSSLSSAKTRMMSVNMERKSADFSGKWTMKSSENFEELLKALGE